MPKKSDSKESLFPQETVEKAKFIASLYNDRYPSSAAKAAALYDGKFLEISYGFEDALVQGKMGVYLHEVKKSAECFSLMGINYIIAKELGLQPKMYSMTGMKDFYPGENSMNKSATDHSFITVMLPKGECIIDPNYSVGARIKEKHSDHFLIRVKSGSYGLQFKRREFTSLEELTEEDYVQEMEKMQGKGSGKYGLSASQLLRYKKERVRVQYNYEDNSLQTAIDWSTRPLDSECESNQKAIVLRAPLEDDGSWNLEEATLRAFSSRKLYWKTNESVGIHEDMTIPYSLAKKFFSFLEMSQRHAGRTSNFYAITRQNTLLYFRKRGFDADGILLFDNGVDPIEYQEYRDELAEYIPGEEVDSEITKKNIAYRARRRVQTPNENNQRLVYSTKERYAFVHDNLDKLKELKAAEFELMYDRHLAEGKLLPNLKRIQSQLLHLDKQDEFMDRFENLVPNRGKHLMYFDYIIDTHMFNTLENDYSYTEEDRNFYYLSYMHANLVNTYPSVNLLEVRKYQPGLKKLLSN